MKKRNPCIIVVLLVLTFLFSFVGCAKISDDRMATPKVQNLEKLCLVWGYTKYTHPAFLFGEKDWDEELLNLIPVVSEAKAEEVNDILHEWFVSLGEIDYGTSRVGSSLPEDRLVIQADTGWTKDKDYLGENLTNDLSLLQRVPSINRSKAPVQYGSFVPDFSNENSYEEMNYADLNYRLLGLFRLWNAMEYHYPYLDILDEDWHDLLSKYISEILKGSDRVSYELTIASLCAKLQDAHVALYNSMFPITEFGLYGASVELVQAEGQLVVYKVLEEDCQLQVGDVICKLEGTDIKDIIAHRREYVSTPTEDKIINSLGGMILRSDNENFEVTVLRDGKEQAVTVKGKMSFYITSVTADSPYQILENNIGVLNPGVLESGGLASAMNHLDATDGLIIDLRQYPTDYIPFILAEYLVDGSEECILFTAPSMNFPGIYVKNTKSSGRTTGSNTEAYQKPVVVLMDERTQSMAEYTIMSIRNGENVTIMGENSVGSDGDVAYLPLPGGISMMFTSQGIYTPDGGQTQRIGLTPDIEVHPTIEGIKEGRDELLEAAVAYIQEQNGR